MPLAGTESVLSASLRAALVAKPDTGVVDDVGLTEFCDTVASTLLAHIVANAVVVVASGIAVTVAVPAGTGATVAPGTGTIT